MSLLSIVEEWHYRGVAVFPVDWQTKRPAIPTWKPYQDRLPSDDELRSWFRGDRFKSYAVVCGWRGLTVLDFDDMGAYARWLELAAQIGGTMARATTSLTVGTARGKHVYVHLLQPTATGKFKGGDVKARGGYVVGPGSLHPSGCLYTSNRARVVGAHRLEEVLPRELLSIPTVPAPRSILSDAVDNRTPWDCLDNPPAPVSCADVKAHVKAMDLLETEIRDYKTGFGLTNCPLHDDAHPSLAVSMRTGDVRCLAGCAGSRWLDAIGLYAELHHCTTQAALRGLAPRVQRS